MTIHQRIGCQTYSWEMLGEDWTGTPDDILEAVSRAGYDGVEFSNAMIGHYLESPGRFAEALQRWNMMCAAFAKIGGTGKDSAFLVIFWHFLFS